jgi:hypothetical protein
MADPTTGFAPILTSRQRHHPVELPEDPTQEELARDWALSTEDRKEVWRCRGEASRLGFAVQLCVVRRHGRFLDDYVGVSARIGFARPTWSSSDWPTALLRIAWRKR